MRSTSNRRTERACLEILYSPFPVHKVRVPVPRPTDRVPVGHYGGRDYVRTSPNRAPLCTEAPRTESLGGSAERAQSMNGSMMAANAVRARFSRDFTVP